MNEIPLTRLDDISVTRLDAISISILDEIQSNMDPSELVNRVIVIESEERNIPNIMSNKYK